MHAPAGALTRPSAKLGSEGWKAALCCREEASHSCRYAAGSGGHAATVTEPLTTGGSVPSYFVIPEAV